MTDHEPQYEPGGSGDRADSDAQGHHPGHDHERSDVSVRGLALFGLGLILLGIVLQFVLFRVMRWFSDIQASELGRTRPIANVLFLSKEFQPREPPLQVNPGLDDAQMRAAAEAVLNSYAWVDKEAGIARIPIDRAMEIVARRGLPAPPKGAGKEHEDKDRSAEKGGKGKSDEGKDRSAERDEDRPAAKKDED